jgi:hypothetical protein
MLTKTKTGLAAATVLGAVISLGSAAAVLASDDNSPADTPNGPYFYVDTYGVPPKAQRQDQRLYHSSQEHSEKPRPNDR